MVKIRNPIIVGGSENLSSQLNTQDILLNNLEDKIDELHEQNLQNKAVTITQNGTQIIEADTGYDALSSVTLTINVAGGSEEIEVTLPSAFSKCTDIYYCDVENNKYLISGQGYPHTTVGVWLYNATSNTISQIYDQADAWLYKCQQVGNNWLITSGYSQSKGLLLYKPSDDSVTNLANYNFLEFVMIGDTKCICSNQYVTGIYVYDDSTEVAVPVFSSGASLTTSAEVNGKYILTGSTAGVYLFDSTTNTMTRPLTSGTALTNLQVVGSYCLISSTNSGSANLGIWLYDGLAETVTQIYTTGYNWIFDKVRNNCLCASQGTSNTGILLFRGSNTTISQIYTTGYRWLANKLTVDETRRLMSSSTSGSNGLLLYNDDVETVTAVYSSLYNWNTFKEVVGNRILITNGGSGNILQFNKVDNTATEIYTSGSGWSTFYDIEDNTLVCCNNANNYGILIYDSANVSISSIYGAGYNYNTIEMLTTSTCYLSSSSNSNRRKILYDNSTKTATLVGYRI